MTSDEKLAAVLTALEAVGIRCLIMGGHAVRYYGLERLTDDFDFHLAPDCWDILSARIAQSNWLRSRNPIEFPSWRSRSFRRFQIGVLPNGREEWLEFWKENHLLAPFDELYSRREVGTYGGRDCAFLALPDLIRTKETEREKDWFDIQYLEEFYDSRLAADARSQRISLPTALSQLRSRRGLETHLLAGNLRDQSIVAEGLALATHPITIAILLPAAPDTRIASTMIETAITNRLRTIAVGSPLHLTLVEAVRRRYKHDAMQLDKVDKQRVRAELEADVES